MLSGTTISEPVYRILYPELANPLNPIAAGKMNFIFNSPLRLQNGTAKIATANAELNGQITFLLLAMGSNK